MTWQVKDSIDRIISGKGLLRIPAWWMRSLLRKMVDAIDRVRALVDKVQTNVDKVQGNVDKIQEDMETVGLEILTQVSAVQGNVDKVQGNVDEVRSDVNIMEAKWPVVRFDKEKRWLVISDGSKTVGIQDVTFLPESNVECTVKQGLSKVTVNGVEYAVAAGKIQIPIMSFSSDLSDCFHSGGDGLTGIDLSGLDTSAAVDMSGMFYGNSALTALDVSGFDTSRVTDMSRMFMGCRNLASLDVSNFDLSHVTAMQNMFALCGATDIKMKGLGRNAGLTSCGAFVLSVPSKESLLYILRDHSFDRAAAGYAPCAVPALSNNLDKLTDAEKAAITAKGFTLS